jgi:enamine deaminase RidA (YjgF/YER057c/UK114 family)
MAKVHDPASIGAPSPSFSYGLEVPPNARWLYVSGQVGRAQGRVGHGIEEQAEMTWANILAVLASAGMGMTDVVKATAFLTDTANVAGYRAVRDRIQAGHRPASTLVVISALANPEFLVEVEVTAAKV